MDEILISRVDGTTLCIMSSSIFYPSIAPNFARWIAFLRNTSDKMISLTEEEIDDILYCSRTNEIEELKPYIPSLATKYNTEPASILLAAVDPETGNNCLHYASGNGHLGILESYVARIMNEH